MTGINLIGMPFGEHGLGECLRSRARALMSAGVKVAVLDRNYSTLNARGDISMQGLMENLPVHEINLFCLNLTMMNLLARDEPALMQGRFNIVAPFWEFEDVPSGHLKALEHVDEVWAATKFLQEVYQNKSSVPVHHMPVSVQIAQQYDGAAMRRHYGICEGEYMFLYVFDANSLIPRKDPEALALAFLNEFSCRPDEKVRLVLKYKYEATPSFRKADLDALIRIAAVDERITLIDEKLSREATLALIAGCDAYVSPHRAEGLGLTIVEAMALGKPVAATGWSGSNDICLGGNARIIDYVKIPVGGSSLGDVRPHYEWALPSHDSLQDALRWLYEERDATELMAKRAQDYVVDFLSPSVDGNRCKKRIEEIMQSLDCVVH